MHAPNAFDLRATPRPPSDTLAITEAVVRLLHASTGSGPTRARTTITSHLVLVTLLECRTKRSVLQEEIRAEAVEAVEAITGRRVSSYLAAQEHSDMAILAFFLGR